jgi:hypothetical protein
MFALQDIVRVVRDEGSNRLTTGLARVLKLTGCWAILQDHRGDVFAVTVDYLRPAQIEPIHE